MASAKGNKILVVDKDNQKIGFNADPPTNELEIYPRVGETDAELRINGSTSAGSASYIINKGLTGYGLLSFQNNGAEEAYIKYDSNEDLLVGTNTNSVIFLNNSSRAGEIFQNGNWGIGNFSAESGTLGQLHVMSANSAMTAVVGDASELVLESNTNTGMTIICNESAGSLGSIYFGYRDTVGGGGQDANDRARIQFKADRATTANEELMFWLAGVEVYSVKLTGLNLHVPVMKMEGNDMISNNLGDIVFQNYGTAKTLTIQTVATTGGSLIFGTQATTAITIDTTQDVTFAKNVNVVNGALIITTPSGAITPLQINSPTPGAEVYLATFETSLTGNADVGIKIKGAQAGSGSADFAFIDLANYDSDLASEYVGVRLAAHMDGTFNNKEGKFEIYTSQAGGTLLEAFIADSDQNCFVKNGHLAVGVGSGTDITASELYIQATGNPTVLTKASTTGFAIYEGWSGTGTGVACEMRGFSEAAKHYLGKISISTSSSYGGVNYSGVTTISAANSGGTNQVLISALGDTAQVGFSYSKLYLGTYGGERVDITESAGALTFTSTGTNTGFTFTPSGTGNLTLTTGDLRLTNGDLILSSGNMYSNQLKLWDTNKLGGAGWATIWVDNGQLYVA